MIASKGEENGWHESPLIGIIYHSSADKSQFFYVRDDKVLLIGNQRLSASLVNAQDPKPTNVTWAAAVISV